MSSLSSLSIHLPSEVSEEICSFGEEIKIIEEENSAALSAFKKAKDDPKRADLLLIRDKINNYKGVFEYLLQLLENPIDEENPTQVLIYKQDREIKALASFNIDAESQELFIETILKTPRLLLDRSNKGIGKEVLQFLFTTAKSYSLAKVALSPTKESYGFYEKMDMVYDSRKNKFSFLLNDKA
jgi:hypothetical protein